MRNSCGEMVCDRMADWKCKCIAIREAIGCACARICTIQITRMYRIVYEIILKWKLCAYRISFGIRQSFSPFKWIDYICTYRWGDADGTCENRSHMRFHEIVIKLSKRIFEYTFIWPSGLFQLHAAIRYSRKMLTKPYRHMIIAPWKCTMI